MGRVAVLLEVSRSLRSFSHSEGNDFSHTTPQNQPLVLCSPPAHH